MNKERKNWIEVRFDGDYPERRAYHVSFLHNNILYIHGGEDHTDGTLDSMWALNLEFLMLTNDETHIENIKKPKWERITTN